MKFLVVKKMTDPLMIFMLIYDTNIYDNKITTNEMQLCKLTKKTNYYIIFIIII